MAKKNDETADTTVSEPAAQIEHEPGEPSYVVVKRTCEGGRCCVPDSLLVS